MERAFKIFDRDGNGDISLAEFIDTMYQFAGKGQAEKILFLFKVYDIDGMCKHNSFHKLIINLKLSLIKHSYTYENYFWLQATG